MSKWVKLVCGLPRFVVCGLVLNNELAVVRWLDVLHGTHTPVYRQPTPAELVVLQAKVYADCLALPGAVWTVSQSPSVV